MSRDELRCRAATTLRTNLARVRVRLSEPRWSRRDLGRLLVRPDGAVRARDWHAAHRELAAHFATRESALPLAAPQLPEVARLVERRFPRAADEAAARADRILEGRYTLLGYEEVAVGTPPSWHADAVHHRTAPLAFWADVPYLDPRSGDHKIIWELNRHQHWLALGRAFHLTGDRRYYTEFVAQLESWMAANPPLVGVNWASMLELGFRSLSWLWALQFFAGAAAHDPERGTPWTVDLLVGLDRQLTHIEANLSKYFSPNTHLTGEALALYVAGLALPELRASRRRVEIGRAVLLAEIDRQIHRDGAHAELSTHYQRYSTDFYLLACAVAKRAGDRAASRFEDAARRQARYLRLVTDDDGRMPLLGDDDGGQLLPICGREPADCRDTLATAAVLLEEPALAAGEAPEETYWFCGGACPDLERRRPAARGRRTEGVVRGAYYVSRSGRGDLVFDVGPHGYLNGGHAHADALSIAMTIGGRPLLVDPGTATYTMNPAIRDLFRSSAMHNTVVVNGRSQSLPRGPFHWRTQVDARRHLDRADYAEASHDGYAPAVHARGIVTVPGIGWFVIDHLLGAGVADADAFWHLHPAWQSASTYARTLRLRHRDGHAGALACSQPLRPAHDHRLQQYAPVYGCVVAAPCVSARMPQELPSSMATLIPAEPALARDAGVEQIAVTHAPGDAWHGVAFRFHAGRHAGMLLAAIERSGLASGADAGPGVLWGCDGAMTDARVAVAVSDTDDITPILINGGELLLAKRYEAVTS